MEPRRIHGGAMVALVSLIVALPAASVGTAVQRLADRRWDDVERETWKRLSELQRTPMHRPVLRGEPVPGNAWNDYVKAGNLKWSEDFALLDKYLDGTGELGREEVQARLEPYLPLLRSVQTGTRRAELLRIVPWNDPLPPLGGLRVVGFGVCRARLLIEQGDGVGAVTLLLDLMQYLADLARLGRGLSRYNSLYYQERILAELNSMMAGGLLDREPLRQVVREMDLLEKSLPTFGTMLREEAMLTALAVLRAKTVKDYLGESQAQERNIPTWRFGFSQKLLMARYAELEYRLAERVAMGDGRPWSEARLATADASSEMTAARHPFFFWKLNPGGKVDYVPIQRAFLECLTHFRLTRAAAETLAEGKVPDLDDPFGDKLRWEKKGSGLKIWSVGWDCVDHGGRGGWSGKSRLDIVLEVRR